MGEPRRVDTKPVGPPISKKKEKKNERSYRFETKLLESTSEYFPEISFADLVEERKRSETSADPLEDVNIKEVEAIARRMEEKYGNSGGKRKRRVDDFCDLGEGYDDNDSFIDNAEAYDELVPSYLTTKLGGFYINSGSLDFREVSASGQPLPSSAANGHPATADEGDSSMEFRVSKKKKRRLKMVESASDEDLHLKKKKKRKRQLMVSGEDGGVEVEELRRKKHHSKHTSSVLGRPKKNKTKFPKEGDADKGKKGEMISENVAQQYDSVIDDVISHYVRNESSSDSPSANSSGPPLEAAASSKTATSCTVASPAASVVPSPALTLDLAGPSKDPPKLPESLPDTFVDQIEELKKAAECSDSKQKFFSPEVNRMLLGLETDSRQQLSAPQRSGVYTYLASFLPVGRETLMKRIKQLKVKEEDSKLRCPIERLKEAVDRAMPALMDKYAADLLVAAQARLESREADMPIDKVREEPASFVSDDEDRPSEMPPLLENGTEKKARNIIVRKKFPWSESLRRLLCDVVLLKMESYLATKTKGQMADDFLKDFLEKEVKHLWPKGWMQTRVLFKESRASHSQWTNPALIKVKKSCLLSGSKSEDSSPMPQLRKAEQERNNVIASSAPTTPKTLLDDIDMAVSTAASTNAIKAPEAQDESRCLAKANLGSAAGVAAVQRPASHESNLSKTSANNNVRTAVAMPAASAVCQSNNYRSLGVENAATKPLGAVTATSESLSAAAHTASLACGTEPVSSRLVGNSKTLLSSGSAVARPDKLTAPTVAMAGAAMQRPPSRPLVNAISQASTNAVSILATSALTTHGMMLPLATSTTTSRPMAAAVQRPADGTSVTVSSSSRVGCTEDRLHNPAVARTLAVNSHVTVSLSPGDYQRASALQRQLNQHSSATASAISLTKQPHIVQSAAMQPRQASPVVGAPAQKSAMLCKSASTSVAGSRGIDERQPAVAQRAAPDAGGGGSILPVRHDSRGAAVGNPASTGSSLGLPSKAFSGSTETARLLDLSAVPLQQRVQGSTEQLALKEMQRHQEGRMTVDQILKLAPSSAVSQQQRLMHKQPALAAAAPTSQVLAASLAGQTANSLHGAHLYASKLHQPWAGGVVYTTSSAVPPTSTGARAVPASRQVVVTSITTPSSLAPQQYATRLPTTLGPYASLGTLSGASTLPPNRSPASRQSVPSSGHPQQSTASLLLNIVHSNATPVDRLRESSLTKP